MCILLGPGHVITAFLHGSLEGGDFHGRANPRVDAVQLLAMCSGVLIGHTQIFRSTQSEKHTFRCANYHYGVQDANGSLEEIF